jgi:hypothetical protein
MGYRLGPIYLLVGDVMLDSLLETLSYALGGNGV